MVLRPQPDEMAGRRIAADDLRVGVPIPYSVYDERHNLLLRQGIVLTNERQIEVLLQRGLFRADAGQAAYAMAEASNHPLTQFERLSRELNVLYVELIDGREPPEFAAHILSLAVRLRVLCEGEPDAALAAVLHDRQLRYPVRHMVHVAIIASLLAERAGLPASEHYSLLCAALTMNIAIVDLQLRLHDVFGRTPTDSDRVRITHHPDESVSRLVALGVAEQTWLDYVAQHHEAWDGHGYPQGLRGDAIVYGARVLAVVDGYIARLRDRADRPARLANESLREIFISRGGSVDPAVAELLVRTLGIYPPGLLVELENGEVGVVTRRGRNAHAPEVHVYFSTAGTMLPVAARRFSDTAPHRIRTVLPTVGGRYRIDPLVYWANPRGN